MKIISSKDYNDMSKKIANIISAKVILKPDSVLGLATGSTPIGTYKKLIEWYNKGDIDFSSVCSVNLDEYCGLDKSHNQSYAYFMYNNFFKHININMENTYVPNGTNTDAPSECQLYEEIIDNLGGIDLQLLGIGHNGHIGFNEPSDCFIKDTHQVELSQKTVDANSKYFDNPKDMPKYAYTMGMGSIMKSKKIIVMVSGADKSDILKAMVTGPITPKLQGSILQLHPDVTIVADEAALSKF